MRRQSRTGCNVWYDPDIIDFRVRVLQIIGLAALIAAAVYGVPSAIEVGLLRIGAGPWLACVLLGDVIGCAVLYILGLRRLAIALYVVCSGIEAATLLSHHVPANTLVWLTNLLPAAAVAVVTLRVGLRALLLTE
jgi:hypothetical protein